MKENTAPVSPGTASAVRSLGVGGILVGGVEVDGGRDGVCMVGGRKVRRDGEGQYEKECHSIYAVHADNYVLVQSYSKQCNAERCSAAVLCRGTMFYIWI